MECTWYRGATSVIGDASSRKTCRVARRWTQRRQAPEFPYQPAICDELWQRMGRILNDTRHLETQSEALSGENTRVCAASDGHEKSTPSPFRSRSAGATAAFSSTRAVNLSPAIR